MEVLFVAYLIFATIGVATVTNWIIKARRQSKPELKPKKHCWHGEQARMKGVNYEETCCNCGARRWLVDNPIKHGPCKTTSGSPSYRAYVDWALIPHTRDENIKDGDLQVIGETGEVCNS